MPPRRSSGRHRRPKNTGGPAYVTAATLAAFTVSGMNVPGAIGDARQASSSSSPTAAATATGGSSTTFAAVQLRKTLAAQQEERASRLRSAQAEAVAAYRKAAREARIAAEKARPKWVLPVSGFPAHRRLRRVRPLEQLAHRPGHRVRLGHPGLRDGRR